jgi:MFS family permease
MHFTCGEYHITALCFTFGIYIILVHNVKFLVDQGIDKMTAAFIFGMVGVKSSIFRIFWGWLSARIGRELTWLAAPRKYRH